MSERDINSSRGSAPQKTIAAGVAVSSVPNTDCDRAKQRRRALIAERMRVLRLIGGLDETMASL